MESPQLRSCILAATAGQAFMFVLTLRAHQTLPYSQRCLVAMRSQEDTHGRVTHRLAIVMELCDCNLLEMLKNVRGLTGLGGKWQGLRGREGLPWERAHSRGCCHCSRPPLTPGCNPAANQPAHSHETMHSNTPPCTCHQESPFHRLLLAAHAPAPRR